MKRLPLFVSAVVMGMAGCVNDSPLFVTNFYPLDPDGTGECQIKVGEVSQYNGSVNIAAGANFYLVTALKSTMESSNNTVVDSVPLANGIERNTILVDTLSLTYTAPATEFYRAMEVTSERVPVSIPIKPGADSLISMAFFGPAGYTALNNVLSNPITDGGFVDDGGFRFFPSFGVKVKVEFSGDIISGGRVRSVPVTFPIDVYNTRFKCPAGQFPCPTSICGNVGGQDGRPIICSSPDPDGGMPVCPVKK